MVWGFESPPGYMSTITDYIVKMSYGMIDTAPSKEPPTLKYRVGDKVVILPEWDGRILGREKYIEHHKGGRVGTIVRLGDPAIICNGSNRVHYQWLVMDTDDGRFACHPNCYLLGYKLMRYDR